MPTIEARPSPHRTELRSPSRGPRSRERLNQLGHHAVAVPPERTTDRNPATAAPEQPRMVDLFAGIGAVAATARQIALSLGFAVPENTTTNNGAGK